MVGFSGVHREGFNDADVEIIRILDGSEIETVPRGVARFFPNFIGLHMRRTAIKRLTGDELLEYPRLQWFGLETSEIEFIPGNLFKPTPNILMISFGSNRIKRVGTGLLDNLYDLQRVYFLNNVCIDMASRARSEIQDIKEVLRRQCRWY
jgi:hypothetical protein